MSTAQLRGAAREALGVDDSFAADADAGSAEATFSVPLCLPSPSAATEADSVPHGVPVHVVAHSESLAAMAGEVSAILTAAQAAKHHPLLSVDAEWRPSSASKKRWPVALLQVAIRTPAAQHVWLLDMLALHADPNEAAVLDGLSRAIGDPLKSTDVFVLGFGADVDLRKCATSYPAWRAVFEHTARMVDLLELFRAVRPDVPAAAQPKGLNALCKRVLGAKVRLGAPVVCPSVVASP